MEIQSLWDNDGDLKGIMCRCGVESLVLETTILPHESLLLQLLQVGSQPVDDKAFPNSARTENRFPMSDVNKDPDAENKDASEKEDDDESEDEDDGSGGDDDESEEENDDDDDEDSDDDVAANGNGGSDDEDDDNDEDDDEDSDDDDEEDDDIDEDDEEEDELSKLPSRRKK